MVYYNHHLKDEVVLMHKFILIRQALPFRKPLLWQMPYISIFPVRL